MIKINQFVEEPVTCYDNQDNCIGTARTELEFLDFRAQIREHKVSGYYIIFKNNKYEIDSNGRVKDYPDNLFPDYQNQLIRLIKPRNA